MSAENPICLGVSVARHILEEECEKLARALGRIESTHSFEFSRVGLLTAFSAPAYCFLLVVQEVVRSIPLTSQQILPQRFVAPDHPPARESTIGQMLFSMPGMTLTPEEIAVVQAEELLIITPLARLLVENQKPLQVVDTYCDITRAKPPDVSDQGLFLGFLKFGQNRFHSLYRADQQARL